MKTVWSHHSYKGGIHDAICNYVSLKIWGEPRQLPLSTAMSVMDDNGRLLAAMVYYDYDEKAGVIQVSGAAETPRWLTRPILREMFSFPFDQLKCQAVVMRVDPDDKRLGRMLPAYGFEKNTLKRLRGRDRDECLYVLYDDVWRANGFHKE